MLDEVLIIENIGRNMLAKRQKLNWTQARASEECDLSERAYGEIERGNTNPTIITLVKICRGLGMMLEEIIADPATESIA